VEPKDTFEWAENFQTDSAMGGLAASLFVGDANPGCRLMAVFTAYFDASGSPESQPYVIVTGFIANVFQWRTFEVSWDRIHKSFGMDLPFHMADFMAALSNENYKSQKNARKDYVEIAKDGKRSWEFLRQLCQVPVLMANCSISCLVSMDIYNGVSSLLDLRKVVPPYALGARTCIARVHRWQEEFAIPQPVECIFEEGDFEQGKFTDLMVDEGMDHPIYRKKKDFAGLQAADLFSWEEFNFLKRVEQQPDLSARDSLKLLIHAIPKMHVAPDTVSLIKLCEAKGINPATGIRDEKKK
jgi:hypothetical protein